MKSKQAIPINSISILEQDDSRKHFHLQLANEEGSLLNINRQEFGFYTCFSEDLYINKQGGERGREERRERGERREERGERGEVILVHLTSSTAAS